MKKSIVDETVGILANELETQDLDDVVGGTAVVASVAATISAATAITALTSNATKDRGCGDIWTVSYECNPFGGSC